MAVLSIALGGCVIVLPACPGPTVTSPTSVAPETAPVVPRPVTAPPPTPPTEPRGPNPAPLTRYAFAVLDDRPVAYWRFEEEAGVVAMDASGQNRHGRYLDGPVVGDSVGTVATGRAVSLESQTDGVLIEYAPWTDMPSLTVEAWVRASQVSSAEGMIIADKGYTWGLFIDPSGRPSFHLPGDIPPETLAPDPIVAGRNYHLAGTFDDGAMTLYVNGVAVSHGVANVTAIRSSPQPIHLGRGVGAVRFEFHGVINDVALYDRALTADAIVRHYQTGR